MRGAQSGAVADLEALFRFHWPHAYRAAYLIAQDRNSAQEVAQEAFLAGVRVLQRFSRDQPFGAWLYRTVVTRSIDAARGRVARRGAVREALLHVPDPLGWSQPVVDPLADDEALGIAHGLSFLSPEQRAGIVLRYQFQYSPGEIAETLDLSRSTAAARLRRDRDNLEARLAGSGPLSARDLQSYLHSIPLPDERAAAERSWEVVRAAFGAREPASRRRRLHLWWLVLVLVVAAGVAAAVTPVREGVVDWIRDRTGEEGTPPTTQAVTVETGTPLPSPGRLLVSLGGRISVLEQDGTRRELGSYEGASWSPDGALVTAWQPGRLDALDPSGQGGVQWSVDGEDVADAAWSPDGFRIAYRSGTALRVVAANGTGDRRLARRVAPVAPAWHPGERELVAYADPRGRVVVVDAETRKAEWKTDPGPPVVALAWTDVDRLAVLGERQLVVFDAPAKPRATVVLPDGSEGTGLATRPGSRELAYTVYAPRTGGSSLYVLDTSTGSSRLLFAGAGRLEEPVWSPDGAFVLVAWHAADQWLFIPAGRSGAVAAEASVSELVAGEAGFPQPLGWCCTEG